MSRIFDPLQRPEAERSGLSAWNLSSVADKPLKDSGTYERAETTLCTTVLCPSCRSSVPENNLFCSKCDVFLGAVVRKGECKDDCEKQRCVRIPEPRRTWIGVLWLHIRRPMILGSAAFLAIFLCLLLAVFLQRLGH